VKERLRNVIKEALKSLNLGDVDFVVEHPTDLKMGDYATNVAIKYGHTKEIKEYLDKNKPKEVDHIELAGPGFINFYLSKEFFKESLEEIIEKGENFGKNTQMQGLRIMVEHTDPNPFKAFHIGHLMPNVIGSTLARIFEWNGAEVKQANYQGDVGMHVAKALWKDDYVLGSRVYEEDPQAKAEIEELNKKIYDQSNPVLNERYEKGKKESLEKFEEIYKRLNTTFDYYFFESETAPVGQKIVEANIGRVFEKSEGAIVFKGSHTRVFINSQGLPTYEAKDLGNAQNKFDRYPYDLSIVVTGNEIRDYFKVVLEAMSLVLPALAQKTKHLSHGMLRLSTGKMSSRTGDVITAEELIEDVKQKVKDNEEIAIGAIKYMILRQAIGNDIIFDIERSVSTEGDSGVYLQYAYARTNSLLEKAEKEGDVNALRETTHEIERLLYRFPEVVERAGQEYAPHHIVTYLTELASSFNNFYAHEQIIDDSPESPYRLAITKAFNIVMKNGLTVLGIPTPESM
jgi:arginyl-tRNA synthetase